MLGATITVKLVAVLAEPAGLVTLISPEAGPAGTVARSWVSLSTVKTVAAVLLKATALTPVNPLPASVTSVPTGPLAGANEAMLGARITVKLLALLALPAALVTLIS